MKKLLIVLFLIGGMFMLKPIDVFLKSNLGNIMHRKNLTTGIVKAINPNGSYDVEIGESGKIHKKIFTLSPDPDLAVEDKVRIANLHGSKEDPILLAPTRVVAAIYRGFVLITASPSELQLFDMNGALVKQLAVVGWSYAGCSITVDSQGNIYTDEDYDVLKKYDSNLNLLVTKNIESANNWLEGINIGSDGYLYTLEGIANGYNIKKRSTSDLTIIETIPITSDSFDYHSGGLGIDLDGNFYMKGKDELVYKYNSSGMKVATIDMSSYFGGDYHLYTISEYAGCCVLGNYVYFASSWGSHLIYMPLNLSTAYMKELGMAIQYAITVADNYLICSGWDGDNDGATSKYDSNRNLIWTVKLGGSTYGYKAGGYNF